LLHTGKLCYTFCAQLDLRKTFCFFFHFHIFSSNDIRRKNK